MPGYITIPRSDYESLLREVKRGAEVCVEISALRLRLLDVSRGLHGRLGPVPRKELMDAISACEEVARLRVELSALERRLREFDQELTPVRPPSSADIKAAFDASVDFASGKKKPPGA